MELEIKERIPEQLLKRERINFIVEFEGATPPVIDVRKLLAQKLSVDMKQLVVRRLYNEYGVTRAKGYAYVYESREGMLKTEPDFIKKKNKVEEDTQPPQQAEQLEEQAQEQVQGEEKEETSETKEESKEGIEQVEQQEKKEEKQKQKEGKEERKEQEEGKEAEQQEEKEEKQEQKEEKGQEEEQKQE